jgi:DNA (cytosine-5)-methyltransferase 1
MRPQRPTFYEFFAGGGMARAGLGPGWSCLFANDFDARKGAAYSKNWGGSDLRVGDVWSLSPSDLPDRADLAWASSPCQDLSLAGRRAGLSGARSSAFWGFWRLVEALDGEGRAPRAVVIENVVGLLTSHGGADFNALCEAFAALGYRVGALEIDASHFLPQSRPRMFAVGVRDPQPALLGVGPQAPFHTPRVLAAHARLSPTAQATWAWWRLEAPARRNTDLASLLEPDKAVAWATPAQTAHLLGLLAPLHRAKLAAAQAAGGRRVAAVFRRTRVEDGRRTQRAELRFDGMAGCLRTPAGGSSRQMLLVVEGERVRLRGLTAREGARLMGLPDSYALPTTATAALHLVGDGVAAPVVRHLARQLLEPALAGPGVLAAE